MATLAWKELAYVVYSDTHRLIRLTPCAYETIEAKVLPEYFHEILEDYLDRYYRLFDESGEFVSRRYIIIPKIKTRSGQDEAVEVLYRSCQAVEIPYPDLYKKENL